MSLRTGFFAFLAAIALPCAAASATDEPCSPERLAAHGGSFLAASDGVRIWYKLAGRDAAPVIAYLHGGPGYNAFTFERSAGAYLERRFRVLYFDQRGCGRSTFEGAESLYGMRKTIADLEELRATIRAERLILVAHSFGGAVAAEYLTHYPERVAAIVMVDTADDLPRAIEYQVERIDSIAERTFPAHASEIHRIARGAGAAMDKLAQLYEVIGRLPLQRELHYADAANQDRMETLDEESGFLNCTSANVVAALAAEGFLTEPAPTLTRRLQKPTLLVAGRASHVIGEKNIRRAAAVWGARLEWLDAGHFVYFEQPQAFAELVERFVKESVR